MLICQTRPTGEPAQLVFFAEFLAATGVFERWVSACPLSDRSDKISPALMPFRPASLLVGVG